MFFGKEVNWYDLENEGWYVGISYTDKIDEDMLLKTQMKLFNEAFDGRKFNGLPLCSEEHGNIFIPQMRNNLFSLEDAFTLIKSWGLNPTTVLIPGITASGLDYNKLFVLTDAPDGLYWSHRPPKKGEDDEYVFGCNNPKGVVGMQNE